jgi:hypothetical protein
MQKPLMTRNQKIDYSTICTSFDQECCDIPYFERHFDHLDQSTHHKLAALYLA